MHKQDIDKHVRQYIYMYTEMDGQIEAYGYIERQMHTNIRTHKCIYINAYIYIYIYIYRYIDRYKDNIYIYIYIYIDRQIDRKIIAIWIYGKKYKNRWWFKKRWK